MSKPRTGSVYLRGQIWWIRWYDDAGIGHPESTKLTKAEDPDGSKARAVLDLIHDRVMRGERPTVNEGPITVGAYFATWRAKREQVKKNKSLHYSCAKWLIPQIKDLRLADVRPRHLVAMIEAVKGEVAPRTLWSMWSIVCVMFRDAKIAELISDSPCTLPVGCLPPRKNANPEHYAEAYYRADEAQALISDTRIALDRRVLYAIKIMTGARHGEAVGLRWTDIVEDRAVRIAYQYEIGRDLKAGGARLIPLHPALRALLTEWRAVNGQAHYIVARKGILPIEAAEAQEWLDADAAMLGIRRLRGHDMRATFKTLLGEAGCPEHINHRMTHAKAEDAKSTYIRGPHFEAARREVEKLPFSYGNATIPANPAVILANEVKTVLTSTTGQGGTDAAPSGQNQGVSPQASGQGGPSADIGCSAVPDTLIAEVRRLAEAATLAASAAAQAAAAAAQAAAACTAMAAPAGLRAA